MARLFWFILRWRLRAIRLQRRLAAQPPDAWMDRIRLRICNFLLARYAHAPDALPPTRDHPPAPRPWLAPRPVIFPEDRPPRPTDYLFPLLRDIRAQNHAQRASRRWRFWP